SARRRRVSRPSLSIHVRPPPARYPTWVLHRLRRGWRRCAWMRSATDKCSAEDIRLRTHKWKGIDARTFVSCWKHVSDMTRQERKRRKPPWFANFRDVLEARLRHDLAVGKDRAPAG